jgi:adenine-specific DNA-methyltransferase
MMNTQDLKRPIETALKMFATKPVAEAATELFDVLGYRSEKKLPLKPNTPDNFLHTFARNRPFNPELALTVEWRSVDFLFQLTDDEVRAVALGDQSLLFESRDQYEGAVIESYLFFAIELKPRRYTRTELAGITRAVNRLFSMPVLLLFRHGDTATLAVIRRRLHKRDESRDVLEKVTLIKDIVFADPIRAHIEILHDLALPILYDEYRFHNFVGLHQAWEKRLASYALNERFYREVAAWYFWALAHPGVMLPRAIESLRDKDEREKQRSVFFIRLLTRLIFCWFLQEKRLIPRDLFRPRSAANLLKDASPKSGTYYRAFLQNLFFGTLNQEQEKRGWRKEYEKSTRKGNRGATNLWRYRDLLQEPASLESLLRNHIPFVNGGLFDCLDQVFQDSEGRDDIRLDDFSEEKGNALCLPNELFFGDERELDLSGVYDDERRKREKVRGLIETLSRYKFTVEENTPLEEEIALDPELLGKVFENLLASYNEDTRTTARKALGGFYTPREIVSYMVDEALIAFLQTAMATSVAAQKSETEDLRARLLSLFSAHTSTFVNPFDQKDTSALIAAIGRVKIIDPACGSGAFPMGALHRLVDLLQKLDPNNETWKRDRLAEAERYCDILRQSDASRDEVDQCEARIEDIRKSFDTRYHALDFARKLYLIENAIYGVDIQPIATQIAKLRFFIALIVDQHVSLSAPNLGVRPLPNLETRIVAADALVPLERPDRQMDLLEVEVRPLRRQLEEVRHNHFNARTPSAKSRCRQRDAELRRKLADLLRGNGLPAVEAKALAGWDPYDQNHAAPFFDSEWMFGVQANPTKLAAESNAPNGSPNVTGGFDIVIGNPPYVRIQTLRQQNPKVVEFYKAHYESAKKGNYDLYVVFVEAGLNLLTPSGQLAFILPHKFFNAQYGEPLRGLIAKGRYLRHVVHFGDQQVFPGATNYVCLLFLAKAGADVCRFVRPDNLAEWLRTFQGTERDFSAATINQSEWNFTVGRDSSVFDKLRRFPQTLGQIAAGISQGIRTSANEVYVLDVVSEEGEFILARSKQLEQEVLLERKAVFRFLQGRDIKAFSIQPSQKVVVIPYRYSNGRAELITLREIEDQMPKLYNYLRRNKQPLEAREDGRMCGQGWYGFIYPKNIEVMSQPKLLVPDIADRASFALDERGEFAFTSGYGVTLKKNAGVSLKFVLGSVNSKVLDFFWRKVSTPLRGGFYRYFTQFIEQFPIPTPAPAQEEQVVRLVNYLIWLNAHFQLHQRAKLARDTLMLAWWEQVLNGLLYELYFPDDLHPRGLHLFDLFTVSDLPQLDAIAERERLIRLRTEFERTYATDHPLRGALSTLHSLEIVRTIEGES